MSNGRRHTALIPTVACCLLVGLSCERKNAATTETNDVRQSREAHETMKELVFATADEPCAKETAICRGVRFSSAAVNEKGDIVFFLVSSRRPQLYLVHGGSNRFVKLGGYGAGPGEYRIASKVGFALSGHPIAFDAGLRRIVEYDTSGNAIATSAVSMPPGYLDASFVRGRLLAVGVELTRQRGDSATVSVFALDTGAAPQLLANLPIRQPSWSMGDMRPAPRAFAPHPRWGFRNDGRIVFTDATVFDLEVMDASGRLELRVGFETQPRHVTAADRRLMLSSDLTGVRDKAIREALIAASMEGAAAGPDRHPAVTNLVVGEDDATWVRESPREAADSVQWVAYDSEWNLLGRGLLGASDRLLATRGGRLLVTNDESEGDVSDLRWLSFSLRQPTVLRSPGDSAQSLPGVGRDQDHLLAAQPLRGKQELD